MASFEGNADVVKLLLDHYAPVDARDVSGVTSLHVASGGGHTAAVKLLLEHRASVDVVDSWMGTPLMRASAGGHTAAVKLLLEHGAQVDLLNDDGRSALMKAVEKDDSETIKLLLEHGAQVDLQNSVGVSALALACFNDNISAVKTLIEYGANIHLEIYNPNRDTPLSLAKFSGSTQLVNILLGRPTLRDAFGELLPLSSDWQSIGTLLDFEEGKLDQIFVKHNYNANNSLKALLKEWLDRPQPPPTWKSLIKTIQPLNNEIAKLLAKKYHIAE